MTTNKQRRPEGNQGGAMWLDGHPYGTAPYEPSAWMREMSAMARSRPMCQLRLAQGFAVHTVATLPAVLPRSIEDHTCDRCRTYQRRHDLIMFRYQPDPDFAVLGGLCHDCARREGWVR